jgi:hypothetical protein
MSTVAGAWIGCSSNGTPGASAQSCHGSPGDEFCACNSSGNCNSGFTCAVDIQQCVHLAGTPLPASGGSNGTGGGTGAGTGGVNASGGSAGSRSTGTGGVLSTGGTGAVAGSRGTGGGASGGSTGGAGRGSSGGSTGAGNATGGGGMTSLGGATGTGGATATTCENLKPSASGNCEFTHYNFGMGTGMDSSSHMYLTACGYLGSESNTIDTVVNIANTAPAKNTYFAAIPGKTSGDFNSSASCGSCVQITNGGSTIIATIIDECPEDSNPVCAQNPTGELDLSADAFNALHFANGNPTGTSWKVVPCPVTGNVAVRIKPGNQNEAFIENTILAIQSVSGPGGNASHTSYGAWHFNANLGSGSQLTLTDAANRTLQVTLTGATMGQNQDTGKQFPACQ